jgi:hypothetical protein
MRTNHDLDLSVVRRTGFEVKNSRVGGTQFHCSCAPLFAVLGPAATDPPRLCHNFKTCCCAAATGFRTKIPNFR